MMRRIIHHARALTAALPLQGAPPQGFPQDTLPVLRPNMPRVDVAPAPARDAPSSAATPVTLQFIAAQPTLPANCHIAGQYEGGILKLRSHPPVEVPVSTRWGTPVVAKVAAAQVGEAGTAQVEGWVTAFDMPVLSLRWLPRTWWDDNHSGPGLVGQIWQAVAPPSQTSAALTSPPTPPVRLQFTGEVNGAALRLDVAGAWDAAPHSTAQVTQHITLSPTGDYTPGAGGLTWTGPLSNLSQFVDTQLLPLLGEAPVQHAALQQKPAAAVQARAVWQPGNDGLGLSVWVHQSDWALTGSFVQATYRTDFGITFQGNPARFSQAAAHVQLPRLCQIDDVATWVSQSSDVARAWSQSTHAWEGAHATLQLRGESTAAAGVRGVANLSYQHGACVDHLSGRIGPPAPTPRAPLPHLIDEAGPLELAPAPPHLPSTLRLMGGLANFLSGGHLQLQSQALRDLGAWTHTPDVHLSMRRYMVSTPTAPLEPSSMPNSALRSLLAVWRKQNPSNGGGHPHKARHLPVEPCLFPEI